MVFKRICNRSKRKWKVHSKECLTFHYGFQNFSEGIADSETDGRTSNLNLSSFINVKKWVEIDSLIHSVDLIKLNWYLLQQFHTFSAKKYRDKFKVWDIFQVIWLNFIRKKSWSQKTQILMKPPLYGNMKSERWRFITFQQTIDENDAPLWYKVKCS